MRKVFLIFSALLFSLSSAFSTPPDTVSASYLTLASFTQRVVCGDMAIIIVSVKGLSGETDTSFSGSVAFDVIEENPDGSVEFFLPSDFSTPVDEVALDEGEAFLFMGDTEAEYILVRVHDPAGEITPSIYIPFKFLSSGGDAVSLIIDGSHRYPVSGSPFAFYRVLPVDAMGVPTSSYREGEMGFASGVFSVKIIRESNPDSSAAVSSLFSGESGDSVDVTVLGGAGYFTISDIEPETLWLQAYSTISDSEDILLPSPEFAVLIVESDEPYLVTAYSPYGAQSTVGYPSRFVVFTMSGEYEPVHFEGELDFLPHITDITGSESASVSPAGWLTLEGGFGGFAVEDTEPDSAGVIVDMELSDSTFAPPFIFCSPFYPEGRGIRLGLSVPAGWYVGGELPATVRILDYAGNIDDSASGWYYLEANGVDLTLYDHNSDEETDGYIWLEDGQCLVGITTDTPQRVTLVAKDRREVGIFGSGYINESVEREVEFFGVSSSPGNQYKIFSSGMGIFRVGDDVPLAVGAVNNLTGEIDTSYSGLVNISASGSAEVIPPDGVVALTDGMGVFYISDDVAEEVDVCATGSLLPSSPITLTFLGLESAGILVSFDLPGRFVAGETVEGTLALMTYDGINSFWSGAVALSVTESNPNGSFVPYMDTTYIPITAGFGHIAFTNLDAETLAIGFSLADGEPSPIFHDAQLVSLGLIYPDEVPDVCSVDSTLDSLVFSIRDISCEEVLPYDGVVDLYWLEGNPNGSATFTPSDPEFSDGRAVVHIEDTEPETLLVYLGETELVQPYDTAAILLDFRLLGVDKHIPYEFALEDAFPNPFNSVCRIEYTVAGAVPVHLEIFDILGKKVADIRQTPSAPGRYAVLWDAGNLPSGIYFCRMRADSFSDVKKLILLK